MSDLHIPDTAELAIALGNPRQAIRLTVVAELRHLASTVEQEEAELRERFRSGLVRPDTWLYTNTEKRADSLAFFRRQLIARADELDGGAS
jgi:hypothetical protein